LRAFFLVGKLLLYPRHFAQSAYTLWSEVAQWLLKLENRLKPNTGLSIKTLLITLWFNNFMKNLLTFVLFSLFAISVNAVELSLTDLNGKESKLSDHLGKWVVVNYWATWCPPCREEMPELQAFHDNHFETDGVVLGLNTEVISGADIKEFLEDYFVSYPNSRVGPVSNTEFGKVPGLPTTFLISPEGNVEARQVGGVTREMIEKFINKWEAKQNN